MTVTNVFDQITQTFTERAKECATKGCLYAENDICLFCGLARPAKYSCSCPLCK